jgi:hypothetical protein
MLYKDETCPYMSIANRWILKRNEYCRQTEGVTKWGQRKLLYKEAQAAPHPPQLDSLVVRTEANLFVINRGVETPSYLGLIGGICREVTNFSFFSF